MAVSINAPYVRIQTNESATVTGYAGQCRCRDPKNEFAVVSAGTPTTPGEGTCCERTNQLLQQLLEPCDKDPFAELTEKLCRFIDLQPVPPEKQTIKQTTGGFGKAGNTGIVHQLPDGTQDGYSMCAVIASVDPDNAGCVLLQVSTVLCYSFPPSIWIGPESTAEQIVQQIEDCQAARNCNPTPQPPPPAPNKLNVSRFAVDTAKCMLTFVVGEGDNAVTTTVPLANATCTLDPANDCLTITVNGQSYDFDSREAPVDLIKACQGPTQLTKLQQGLTKTDSQRVVCADTGATVICEDTGATVVSESCKPNTGIASQPIGTWCDPNTGISHTAFLKTDCGKPVGCFILNANKEEIEVSESELNTNNSDESKMFEAEILDLIQVQANTPVATVQDALNAAVAAGLPDLECKETGQSTPATVDDICAYKVRRLPCNTEYLTDPNDITTASEVGAADRYFVGGLSVNVAQDSYGTVDPTRPIVAGADAVAVWCFTLRRKLTKAQMAALT